jgi:hypothetical protein
MVRKTVPPSFTAVHTVFIKVYFKSKELLPDKEKLENAFISLAGTIKLTKTGQAIRLTKKGEVIELKKNTVDQNSSFKDEPETWSHCLRQNFYEGVLDLRTDFESCSVFLCLNSPTDADTEDFIGEIKTVFKNVETITPSSTHLRHTLQSA